MNGQAGIFRKLAIVIIAMVAMGGIWVSFLTNRTASAAEEESAVRVTMKLNLFLEGRGEARYEISTTDLYIHIHGASPAEFALSEEINRLITDEPLLVDKRVWLDFVSGKTRSKLKRVR